MSAKKLRLEFTRNELGYLVDALEAIIEDFQYDGKLILAEPYLELENRIREKMGLHANWSLPLSEASR